MQIYPTHCDNHFHGYDNIKEIHELRTEAHGLALIKQQNEPADHIVYCHYDLDSDGNIATVWLYSGLPMTDEEFERVATMKNTFVGAIHRHKLFIKEKSF